MIAAAPPPRRRSLTHGEIVQIRADLGLDCETMASRVGISRAHLANLERGDGLISPLLNNAFLWVEHMRGQLPAEVCVVCDGLGRQQPERSASPTAKRTPGAFCEACDGEGVERRAPVPAARPTPPPSHNH